MGESDFEVGAQAKKALSMHGVKIIFCVGETMIERESGMTNKILAQRLDSLKQWIGADQWVNVVIAYEPVWAVGTGQTPTSTQIQEAHENIRFWVEREVHPEIARNLRIIYGGSVTKDNANDLIQERDVDGFLVGGASITPDFKDIVEKVDSHY